MVQAPRGLVSAWRFAKATAAVRALHGSLWRGGDPLTIPLGIGNHPPAKPGAFGM